MQFNATSTQSPEQPENGLLGMRLKHLFSFLLPDIFGISDHDLMYSQEEVDTADELSSGADDDAIQARVSE